MEREAYHSRLRDAIGRLGFDVFQPIQEIIKGLLKFGKSYIESIRKQVSDQ